MTTLREAAQLALEYISWQAFGECRIGEGPIPEAKDVVRALRKALAEPEQPARVPLTNAQIKSIAYDYGALPEVITVASLLAYSRSLLEIAKSTNTSGCFGPHDEKDDNK